MTQDVASPFRAARLALTGALLSLAACASTVSTTAVPAAGPSQSRSANAEASPHAELAVAVRADANSSGADLRGVLAVHPDLLAQCPALRSIGDKAANEAAWLRVMRTVAGCMNRGELAGRTLVLRGPSRPQVVVQYMFAHLGVPERRVEMSAPDSTSCVSNDGCAPEEQRVELRLADATLLP